MPGLGGAETLAALRQLQPEVKVVPTSGYEKATALRSLGENNLAGFLQKPFTAAALLDTVERVLHGECLS
jgi:DNA-binding NarL/FixJ family response regulator